MKSASASQHAGALHVVCLTVPGSGRLRDTSTKVPSEAPAGSVTDIVSVFLAAAAFVVAVASFWVTSLRRPDVDVWALVLPDDLPGPHNPVKGVEIHAYLANSGASGTFVESVRLVDYRESNRGRAIWRGFGEDKPLDKPIMLDRFEAKHVTFARDLELSEGMRNVDIYARRLATLDSISVTIAWTFRQPQFLRPNVKRRVERRRTLTIDAGTYRRRVIAFWRRSVPDEDSEAANRDEFLADVAEGKRRPEKFYD